MGQTKDDILSLKETLNAFMNKESSEHGVEIQNDQNEKIQFDADKILKILDNEHEKNQNEQHKKMKNVMNKMDNELMIKQKMRQNKIRKENGFENEELDIDLNVVNDILQSHITSQQNAHSLGPAAT